MFIKEVIIMTAQDILKDMEKTVNDFYDAADELINKYKKEEEK